MAGVSVFDGLIAAAVLAGVYFLCWLAYLLFLISIARRHGPQAMRDAAEAIKVFPGAALAEAISRVMRPR
jgi:hypothetical protein